MIRRSLTLRTIAGLTLVIAVFALAACEAAETGTPTAEPATATPSSTADAESTATPATTPQPTVVSPTPTSGGGLGGGATATVQPAPTRSTGGDTATGTGGASSSSAPVISGMSQFDGASLIGQGNVDLGVFEPSDRALNSLCDNIAGGGAAFGANSILNDLSPFGGKFGANSPFNPESATPPQIVLHGQVVGLLTVSPFIDSAVDPFDVLSWLGCPADRGH